MIFIMNSPCVSEEEEAAGFGVDGSGLAAADEFFEADWEFCDRALLMTDWAYVRGKPNYGEIQLPLLMHYLIQERLVEGFKGYLFS